MSEQSFAERELLIKEGELELIRQQAASASWSNPMVLAIFAAAVAGIGNAGAL